MTSFVEISLNGERIQAQAGTLLALLQARGFELQKPFACAINSAFVPRPEWPARTLQSGDCIDVVSPITGG